jgi:hypothetical protein
MKRISTLLLFLLFVSTAVLAQITNVYFNSSPQVDFGVKELEKSFKIGEIQKFDLYLFREDIPGSNIVLAQLKDESIIRSLQKTVGEKLKDLKSEGFSIIISSGKKGKTFYVVGFDEPGLMYGTLELAEQIKLNGMNGVTGTKQNPYMKERGVKFNIPLDVRTPSYSDASDAAQKNIATMWDFNFWKEFIDRIAMDRYNLISLWNLNSFPSMVKVPEYSDVALNNVERSTGKWKEYYPTNGRNLSTPEILKLVEVLKKMTIDQKIAFWRKVMKYGKERNVYFYIITWNVFVNGTGGKYGITDNYENPITVDYIRKSVKQMILTYPDLKGIGLTTGENFIKAKQPGKDSSANNSFNGKLLKATAKEKEDWAFNTYGLGVLDALKEEPGRKITFIHRQHEARALDIFDKFKPLMDNPNINFVFSFKYAQAHAMSSIVQPFCNGFVKELESRGNIKTLWTIRNDDNYYFRWGAPDFVREFIKNIPYDVSEGFYYGSDGWIWGRDFLSKDHQNSRELEIKKHWYHWMLWGRLAYNPNLKDEVFKEMLAKKFPQVSSEKLFDAWQDASMIYPNTTGFHWGAMDFQWYIEGCKRYSQKGWNKYGFEDVNSFIIQKVHPETNNQTIPDYVEMLKSGSTSDKTTPFQVAQKINDYSDGALSIVTGLKAGNDKELHYTLNDIKTMAYLGKYYVHKIKGSAYVEMYRKLDKDKKENQEAAVKELTTASSYWKKYMDLAKKSYKNPVWMNRVGIVDWKKNYQWTLKDIDIAKGNE